MPTRIVLRGVVVWASRDFRMVPRPHEVPHETIDPESYHAPFRDGEGWTDPDDDITYRIVRKGLLDPAQGWGTIDFWLERYNCQVNALHAMCERGMLDAAIEEGSVVKRFRCRDETRVLEFLKEKFPRRQRWIRAPRRVT